MPIQFLETLSRGAVRQVYMCTYIYIYIERDRERERVCGKDSKPKTLDVGSRMIRIPCRAPHWKPKLAGAAAEGGGGRFRSLGSWLLVKGEG